MKYCAYLDIETTGFSHRYNDLTVIGLHLDDGSDEVIQLVGDEFVPQN